MTRIVNWNRQHRRYQQLACAATLFVTFGVPAGSPPPGGGVVKRLYPQKTYSRGRTTSQNALGERQWFSYGAPVGVGPPPSGGIEHRRYPQATYRRGSAASGHAIGERIGTSVGAPFGASAATGGISKARVVMNAMEPLKISTARNIMVWLADSADGKTGKTGLIPSMVVTMSKDGAAFTTVSLSIVERGNGWYNLPLTPTNTDTLGDLAFHITGSGADPCDFKVPVEADRTGIIASHTAGALVEVRGQMQAAIQTDILPDAIPAAGQRGSLGQYAYQSGQYLVNRVVVGLQQIVRKPNGTTLIVLTINDANVPTDVHP